jgi:hypothetical protein
MLIKTNGISIAYRDEGTGIPVIFIHAIAALIFHPPPTATPDGESSEYSYGKYLSGKSAAIILIKILVDNAAIFE